MKNRARCGRYRGLARAKFAALPRGDKAGVCTRARGYPERCATAELDGRSLCDRWLTGGVGVFQRDHVVVTVANLAVGVASSLMFDGGMPWRSAD